MIGGDNNYSAHEDDAVEEQQQNSNPLYHLKPADALRPQHLPVEGAEQQMHGNDDRIIVMHLQNQRDRRGYDVDEIEGQESVEPLFQFHFGRATCLVLRIVL